MEGFGSILEECFGGSGLRSGDYSPEFPILFLKIRKRWYMNGFIRLCVVCLVSGVADLTLGFFPDSIFCLFSIDFVV